MPTETTLPAEKVELQPCPFCSSPHVMMWVSQKDGEKCCCGFCEGCQAEGPHANTEEGSARLWNTRATAQPTPASATREQGAPERARELAKELAAIDGPCDCGSFLCEHWQSEAAIILTVAKALRESATWFHATHHNVFGDDIKTCGHDQCRSALIAISKAMENSGPAPPFIPNN
jgi:hypothetical protein